MVGGYKTSRLALLAAMGMFAGVASAQAADLGGNCCADLEERVAELEATTARKGNRKVSLTVSGHVHEALMWWDDGVERNAYITDSSMAYTRFRFVGKAKINADISAGYLLELGAYAARSEDLTNANDEGTNGPNIRHSAWWIEHKELGKIWVGQTSQATDGITEINLANTGHFANQNQAAQVGSFTPRINGVVQTATTMRGLMGGNSTDSAQIGEGNRRNEVKYESPTVAGFILSAAWGEDHFWDVALRYAGEFSGFKIAAGIGYEETTDGPQSGAGSERACVSGVALNRSDVKCQQLGLSGAIMHVPTGIYVHGAYGRRWDDNAAVTAATANLGNVTTSWYIQGGIEQNWFGIGKSTLFGEYQQYNSGDSAATRIANTKSELTAWGLGFNQAIDAAAMDLYVKYTHYGDMSATNNGGAVTKFDDFQTVIAGGIIRF